MVNGCWKYPKIHGNIRKYMKINIFHELALICEVLACVSNAWTCVLIAVLCFWGFRTHPKRRAPNKHEFGRYSDLQIFYQDPIGEQNDGWYEPPKCQSN